MRVLFPYNPLNEKEADGPFCDEYLFLREMGMECSLFDYDSLSFDEFRPKPRIGNGDVVLYRGWMLDPITYVKLSNLVERCGGQMLTDPDNFLKSHHLPGWYDSVAQFTPETILVENEEEAVLRAEKTGWEKFFVKDFVKSNYSERGSIAYSPQEVLEIIALIREHRGEIEGGIVLRKVEEFVSESEVRYFVFNGKPYSPNGFVPHLVAEIAKLHKAPFYSIDVVERTDGELRLIEIGDGQVSDRKNWDTDIFCKVLIEADPLKIKNI
ncbi:ATP-grasp domain-containing protein [Myxococcota bacterium]|nr:ATP-grasp domain-containing protein [Myxococcota bacterium]MBU1382444.1 ATP-grasp domain-containing protein [Myxococcota bacterium]MBU1495955.1 ATP-grasp domain-containing protein [Myxococcota bacterium]